MKRTVLLFLAGLLLISIPSSAFANVFGYQLQNGIDVIYFWKHSTADIHMTDEIYYAMVDWEYPGWWNPLDFVKRINNDSTNVDNIWKGEYFNAGEEVSLFVYGKYLPYREMEKTFHPEDQKAQETKRTMTEAEKNSTWYFEEFDGRSFPEVGKTYLLHIHKDSYDEYYISGWGLGIQEILPGTNTFSSGESVEEYMNKIY